jgi:hypothetical protein
MHVLDIAQHTRKMLLLLLMGVHVFEVQGHQHQHSHPDREVAREHLATTSTFLLLLLRLLRRIEARALERDARQHVHDLAAADVRVWVPVRRQTRGRRTPARSAVVRISCAQGKPRPAMRELT